MNESSEGNTWKYEIAENESSCFVIMEVPGRIENPLAVIQALGGLEEISSCVARPSVKPLVLRLCPKDPFSKFIPAQTFKSLGLLLSIKRRKSPKGGGPGIKVALEGQVRRTFRFTALADYYLAPEDSLRFPSDSVYELDRLRASLIHLKPHSDDTFTAETPADSSSDPSTIPLMSVGDIPPSLFTRQIHPFDYRYSTNVFSATSRYFLLPKRSGGEEISPFDEAEEAEDGTTANGLTLVERGPGSVCNITARINDPVLPQEEDVPDTVATLGKIDEGLFEEVQKLFEMRPLWQRTSLYANLTRSVTIWKLKPVLAKTCFLFFDGPFRGCLCRLGYDPRKDPSSSIYQSIDFRDVYFRSVKYKTQKGDRHEKGDSRRKEDVTLYSNDYKFISPPNKPSCLYQLCDIEDGNIQHLLRATKPLGSFDNTTGWYSADTLARIRDMMSIRAQALRRTQATNIYQGAESNSLLGN